MSSLYVQAYTARRAERVADEQAQELQVSETRRQREHEQMLVQIHRTERIVDECCGPAMIALWTYFRSCAYFTAEGVSVLEKTNPEIISMLLSHLAAHFETKDDGTVWSNLSRKVVWERKAGFIVTSSSAFVCAPTGAAVQIVGAMYMLPALTQPYIAVTGQPILGVIEADPSGDLAIRYRHFVRCGVIPGLRKVAAILEAHRCCCLRAAFVTPSTLVATLIPFLTMLCSDYLNLQCHHRAARQEVVGGKVARRVLGRNSRRCVHLHVAGRGSRLGAACEAMGQRRL
eukprot:SAG31_NODE_62_length_28678_cov_21.548270_26_plen_287_part_00